MRFLPYLSPSRASVGVHTDADSRYAVSTQVTFACDVWKAACSVGSTGNSRHCCSV